MPSSSGNTSFEQIDLAMGIAIMNPKPNKGAERDRHITIVTLFYSLDSNCKERGRHQYKGPYFSLIVIIKKMFGYKIQF